MIPGPVFPAEWNMDVKPLNSQVPAIYERTVQTLRRASVRSSPVLPEDVVDCVEIQGGGISSVSKQAMTYSPLDRPRKEKGTFIDIWI
jgi:hypothetical protein